MLKLIIFILIFSDFLINWDSNRTKMESLIRLTTIAILIVSTLVNSANISLRPVYERSEEDINFFGKPSLGRQIHILSQDTQRFRSNFHVQNQQRRYISEKEKKQRAQARRFVPVPQDVMNRHIKENAERQELNLKELEAKFIREITAVVKANNYTTVKPVVQKKEEEKQNINNTLKDLPNLVEHETDNSSTEQVRNKRIADDRVIHLKSPRHIPYSAYPRYYTQAHQKNFNANEQPMYGQQYGRYFSSGNNHNVPIKYVPTQQIHTEDVSSLTSSAFKYPAPEPEFSQLNVYKNNENYETSLEALLGKDPNDQIKGLNHLLQQSSANHKVTNEDLRNVNINLKSSSLDVPTQYYAYEEQPEGVFVTPRYQYEPKEEYQQVRDYTPITENVQDIADTRQPVRIITQQEVATKRPATLTSSTNYYKVEVASEVKELPTSAETHIYASSPNYVSGYDNVSIADKNKHNDTKSDVKTLKDIFKQRMKPVTQVLLPTPIPETVTEEGVRVKYRLTTMKPRATTTVKPFRVLNSRLKFGDRLVRRNKTLSFMKSSNRTKRHVPHILNQNLNNKTKSFFHQGPTAKSRYKRSETASNNASQSRLKSSLLNSYTASNSENVKIPNTAIIALTQQVNCSDCFKSNGDSEFYYYDNANSTDPQMDDDFPSYEDLAYNSTMIVPLRFNASNLSIIQVNGTNITSGNPHSEALRYRMSRKPNLYRLLNGLKTRVLRPNLSRFQRYLIKRPIKEYVMYNNNRYGGGYITGSEYDYGSRGVNSGKFENLYDPSGEADEYINDGQEQEEYYDDSEVQEEYEELDGKYTQNRYENIIDRPPYSQYASGYNNYNEDYIIDDAPVYQNKYSNHRFPQNHETRPRERQRYASRYNQHQNYISDDTFADYTRNYRGTYRLPPDQNFDYDFNQQSSNPYIESDEYIDNSESFAGSYYTLGNQVQYHNQQPQKYNQYLDKDFTDSYGNFYESSYGKKKKQDPSNYYVENFNQFVQKPVHGGYHEEHRQKPVSVFNIFRSEAPKKRPVRINSHQGHDSGGVIHIDHLNLYPHGQEHGWKKPPYGKGRPHGVYSKPRRPIKHKKWRPRKWRGSRFGSRKSHRPNIQHVQKNIHKLNHLFSHY